MRRWTIEVHVSVLVMFVSVILMPVSAHAGFTAHALSCAPMYNMIIKTNREGTPAHEEYKKRFFHTAEQVSQMSGEGSVEAINRGFKKLVQELQSGNLPENQFWQRLNACDDTFNFPRSKS